MVDETPCVAPLLRYGADDEEWCVLLVNRKVARIFCGPATALEEIEQLEDDTHGQHQQGGRSQANYQRSVEQKLTTSSARSTRCSPTSSAAASTTWCSARRRT